MESPTISYNYGDVTVELDGYYIFTKDNSTIYLYFSGFSESDKNKLGLEKLYLQSDKAKILEIEAKNDSEFENNFLGVKDNEYYSIVYYPELKKNSEFIIKDHENIICHIDVNEEFNVKNINNYPYRFVDYNINSTQEELIKAFESSDNVNDIISLLRNPNSIAYDKKEIIYELNNDKTTLYAFIHYDTYRKLISCTFYDIDGNYIDSINKKSS